MESFDCDVVRQAPERMFSFQNLQVPGGFVNCVINVKLAKCGDDLKIVDYTIVSAEDFLGKVPTWVTIRQIADAAIKDIEANYKPSNFWEGLPDVFEEAF